MKAIATAALILIVQGASVAPDQLEPSLRQRIQQFFDTQQAEDTAAYLALWSAARRPPPAQLAFVFASGDDVFSDLKVVRATVTAEKARVRVRVRRDRTHATAKNPDGSPRVNTATIDHALTFVREGGEWKLFREGTPADDLASALLDTEDAGAREALMVEEPDLMNVRLVEAMFRQADPLAQQRQYAAARRIYERALEVSRRISDRRGEGQALQNIANSLYFQREFPKALEAYEQRLTIERAAANRDGIASALIGIGTIRYSTFDYAAALAAYKDAFVIQEALGDELTLSTTLISIGNVLYLQGRYEEAIADYARAETLKRKYHDLSGAATALEGLGRVYTAQGDHASALSAYAGVLAERRARGDAPRQASVLHSIGEIHFRLGNLDHARGSFDEARTLFERARDLSGAGRTLQGTALTEMVAAQFALGEKAYERSIAVCTTAEDAECIARAQVGLAFALAAQQKYTDAVPWYRKALAAFQALDMPEPASRARVGLADALTGSGAPENARREAEAARHAATGLKNDDVLWRAWVAEARALRKLARRDAALAAAKAAVATVQSLAALALETPTQVVPRDTTTAFVAAAVLLAESGDSAGAFDTSEAMRVHALRLWLAGHEGSITRGMTDAEQAEERSLTTDLRTQLVRREREAALPKRDTARVAALDAAIADLRARRRSARGRVFARLPELATIRGFGEAATASDLAAVLDTPRKALLALVVDDHDVLVLTAARGADAQPVIIEAHVVPLRRLTLGERIARALDSASMDDRAAWRKAGADVFSLVPPRAASTLAGAKSVLVVPDDLLWRVPFEAMPVGADYLDDRAAVAYAPSVTALLRRGAPAASRAGERSALIVAAPQLPVSTLERLKATAPSWVLRPAEHALAEAKRVSTVFVNIPATTLTGAGATSEAFVTSVRGADLLHIAAPFRVNSASPLFSAVLLSAPDAAEPNGARQHTSVVELRELFNLDANVRAVTLSDPASLSMRDAAAAVPPVHWAWHAAGAQTLLLRRWAGHEQAASRMAAEFYRELRDGKRPEDALRSARANVRSTEGGRAPGAWAGWLLVSVR